MRIVSGGQTGVDRAGLDVALELGLEIGGYVPKGRRAEDGRIPDRYPLTELTTRDYASRTAKNVEESEATLVLYRDKITPGSAFTVRLCEDRGKPCLVVNLSGARTLSSAQEWLSFGPRVLNVAGSRESSAPGIYEQAAAFLRALLGAVKA